MKWTFALTLGVSLGATALVVGCADAPKIGSQQRSTVSSTLATYKATAETTKKYGIATWRLRHVGDGSVLEGLDAKGKSVSHVSLAVRKNKKSEAAMLWFSGGDSRKGFMKGGKEGLAKNTLPGSMPSWATAARRDLLKHAESGRTPYGCADDLFGIFSGLLQQAPSCAKTDTLQTCISKLLQAQTGSSSGLANVSKLLTSCKPATTGSSSSSSGGTASNSSGSSSGSSGKTSSSSSSSGSNSKDNEEEDEDKKSSSSSSSSSGSNSNTSSSNENETENTGTNNTSNTGTDSQTQQNNTENEANTTGQNATDSQTENTSVNQENQAVNNTMNDVSEQDPVQQQTPQQEQEQPQQEPQQEQEQPQQEPSNEPASEPETIDV